MHIHLPKAFHGWREFAKEVGIIVLGVLIALGFEQVAQAWHWHEQARATRQALVNEIEYSDLWAEERLAVQQCLRDRISDLTAKLNTANPQWTADPAVLGRPRSPIGIAFETGIPLVYRAPHRPWLSDEWQTAKSSGVIDHMDRDDARNLEFIYRNIDQLGSLQDEEASLQPQISFLSFNQSLQPQSRVQAFVTLARLDYLNAMQAQSARQMLATIRSAHLLLGPISIGQHAMPFEAARNRIVAALRGRYGDCVVDVPQ
jgi:hypothetical protein